MKLNKRKSELAGLTFALLMTAAPALAIDSFDSAPALPFIMKGSDSWNHFRQAVKNIEDAPEIRALLQKDSIHRLTVSDRVEGSEIETTKFQHYYKGLEVIGSMAFHHQNSQGNLIRNKMRTFDLDAAPTLSSSDAISIAQSVTGDHEMLQPPVLKVLPSENGNSAKLIYWMEIGESGFDGARQIIVDAHSGNVIGDLSENLTLAPIGIYSAKNRGLSLTLIPDVTKTKLKSCDVLDLATGQTQNIDAASCQKLGPDQCQLLLDGDPIMVNPSRCAATIQIGAQASLQNSRITLASKLLRGKTGNVDRIGSTADQSSLNASRNSQTVLSYYLTTHGRNSYDGKGSASISVVHAGLGYSNAHWDIRNSRMVYGEGDGANLGDFTLALDVAGHEMTHGITSATAQLLNMGESGALNEAYSDFFGKMIDFDGDWTIGRKLFLKGGAGKGIRDLANPHSLKSRLIGRPYPATMSEKVPSMPKCDGSNDNCFVHINATIPGHASYLMVQAIGKQKAEKLYFTVLTQALSPNDTLQSAADDTRTLCSRLYDAGTCSQVDQVFRQVGL